MLPLAITVLILVTFAALLTAPFIPGILEFIHPKDNHLVKIDSDYTKDARYFGHSFRKQMEAYVNKEHGQWGIIVLTRGKEEIIQYRENADIKSGMEKHCLLYAHRDLSVGNNCRLHKEVYVKGNCYLKKNVTVRALACDGDFHSMTELHLKRWLDVEKNAIIRGKADLGINVTSGGELHLSGDISFKRLFGQPVSIGAVDPCKLAGQPSPPVRDYPAKADSISSVVMHTNDLKLEPSQHVDTDIVSKGNVTVSRDAVVMGSIKATGPVVIEDGALVAGHCFSNSDIIIKDNVRIGGNIFAQGKVVLGPGVVVGRPDSVKSVISGKKMILHKKVVIFGYVMAEGGGKVVI